METYGEALLRVKRGFLIIGITGYTASGCTTACGVLNREKKPEVPALAHLKFPLDQVDHSKLKRVWSDLPWSRFITIEVSRVILMFVMHQALRYTYSKPPLVYARRLALQRKDDLVGLKLLTDKSADLRKKDIAGKLVRAYKATVQLYGQFKKIGGYDLNSFIEQMQDFGDNIRKYGQPFPSSDSVPDPANIFILPEAIRRLIKAFKASEQATNFVIDAFRNPFEVEYFKRRYREFYLLSINRPFLERRKALRRLRPEFVNKLEMREKGKRIFEKTRENIHDWVTSQNIDECAQKADYFIQNHSDDSRKPPPHLLYHLLRLISLVRYPGCVPPTKDERSMQLAMSARQNSGCLSRHVGAVVTDDEGYILGVGWNNPPAGQVSCSLRTANQLLTYSDKKAFSEYERSQEFIDHIRSRGIGDFPFCFKSELAALKNRPVESEFTRAVHGEENALLQAVRHGTEAVRKAILYTTDSPCTLCAKKSYQLGVSRIVYIEEYPGIALAQTIKTGTHEIKIEQFEGVTGAAYFDAFTTLLPEKDYLKLYA